MFEIFNNVWLLDYTPYISPHKLGNNGPVVRRLDKTTQRNYCRFHLGLPRKVSVPAQVIAQKGLTEFHFPLLEQMVLFLASSEVEEILFFPFHKSLRREFIKNLCVLLYYEDCCWFWIVWIAQILPQLSPPSKISSQLVHIFIF